MSPKKTTYKKSVRKQTKKDSNSDQRALIIEQLPGYFLIACLLASFYFLFKVLSPFLTVLFVAAVLSIVFYPVYKRILNVFGSWKRLASFVTCLIVIVLIVAPITVFIIFLTLEAGETYALVQTQIESGVFDKYLIWEDGGFIYDLKNELEGIVDLNQVDLKTNIINMAQSLSTYLVSQTAYLLRSISGLLLSIFIMLFSMFYFFKDGDLIVKKVGLMSPLPSVYEDELFSKIASMVKAIVVGVFLTAIIQGLLGGIGFAIAGISNPVFWGTAMAFFSLLPFIGTALIWFPAAIILAILGSYGAAMFIFIWGIVVVGSSDNLLRPYLIGGKAKTYPLLTFFVILGGIWTLGFKGIIVGPLVLMVLMSFLHIYEAEYNKVLKK